MFNLKIISFFLLASYLYLFEFSSQTHAMEDEELEAGGEFALFTRRATHRGVSLKKVFTSPTSETSSLQTAIKNIKLLLRIRDFDPSILSESTFSNQPLDFEGLDISFCTKVIDFYSEIGEERSYKFLTEIKGPLINALQEAVKFSYDFPQTLKFLSSPSIFSSSFLDAAIQDIFTNDPATLKNLKRVLQNLKKSKSLSKEDKDSLFPLRKVAGYFYDRKALEYLTAEMSSFFSSHVKESLNFGDPIVRFALLRILQWSGEFLKLLLPSTLNLSTDLPEDNLLHELRDQHLSHISRRKLELVSNSSKEIDVLFEELYDDIKYLKNIFNNIYINFRVDTGFPSPLAHWTYMKSLLETRKETPSTHEWKGLRGLRDLFTYSKKTTNPSEVSYESEVKVLIPLPYSEPELQSIRKCSNDAKAIWDKLSTDQIRDVDTLHHALEILLKRDVTRQICEEFWQQREELKRLDPFQKQREFAKKAKEVRSQYLKKLEKDQISARDKKPISTAINKPTNVKALEKAREVVERLKLDESEFDNVVKEISDLGEQVDLENKRVEKKKEELSQQLYALKEETRAKIFEKTREEVQQVLKKNKEIDETEQKQKKLTASLTAPHIIKPSYGHKNFTDVYRDFHTFLKDQGVQVEEEPYRWLENVQTPVEQLFYKAHCIPIASQSDKLKHRYERVKELIHIIGFIKNLTKVTTDLRFEIEKESFRDFISGKSQLMRELLYKIQSNQPEQRSAQKEDNENNLRNLLLIQEELYKLGSQIVPSLSFLDFKALEDTVVEKIGQFLAKLKESNLLNEQDFKQAEKELNNRSRFDKKKQVRMFVKREQMKSNPRLHEPFMLSQEVEQDVKENKMRYLAYEFLIAAFYELFKEVNDYPELSILRVFDQVRNFFFHTDPFDSQPLIVGGLLKDANIRIKNPFGQLAKEVTILTLNTKFLLEEFLLNIRKSDSHLEVNEPDSSEKQKSQNFGTPIISNSTASKNVSTSAMNLFVPQYETDDLVSYDYKSLVILQRTAGIEELSIRSHFLNPRGELQEVYEIDGQRFRRQNVSGTAMRCFFNAIGLEADIEIAKLKSQQNDPIVRYIIANEIVSASANPDQLPWQLKRAINYALYQEKRAALDVLEEQRNSFIANNPGEDLPIELQTTGQTDAIILEELRERTLSLDSFHSFLDHHIGGEQMMVTCHDVRGEEGGNPNANYTSVDAIAYVNKLGIKIYSLDENRSIHLTHQFIPEGTTEVAYIYHEGVHFQALIPEKGITHGLDSSVNYPRCDE